MGVALRPSQTPLRPHVDFAGTVASGACIVHCLLTPVLISLFPGLIPYLPGDAAFHRILAVGVVLLGAAAFVPGYRIHRRRSLLLLAGTGILLILAVAWSGAILGRTPELLLSMSGSLMLVGAHLLNRTFCRECVRCAESSACDTTGIE